jgi:hypothetical protein
MANYIIQTCCKKPIDDYKSSLLSILLFIYYYVSTNKCSSSIVLDGRTKGNLPEQHVSAQLGNKFPQCQKNTLNETLQYIKHYIVMQESFDPYQEEEDHQEAENESDDHKECYHKDD